MTTTIQPEDIRHNLGARPVKGLRLPEFPDAGAAVRAQTHARPATAVDVHNSASRWSKALLDNAARPSGAIGRRVGSSGPVKGRR